MDDLKKYTLKFSKAKKITKKSLKQAFFAKKRLIQLATASAKLENYQNLKQSNLTS